MPNPTSNDRHVKIDSKTLTAMPVSIQFRENLTKTGAFFRDSMTLKIDDIMRSEYGERVHRLEALVLQDKLANTFHSGQTKSMWPKTTFQMFKETNRKKWWLQWFVMRYPVVYKFDYQTVTVEVNHSYIYPESDAKFRSMLGGAVKFETATMYGGRDG